MKMMDWYHCQSYRQLQWYHMQYHWYHIKQLTSQVSTLISCVREVFTLSWCFESLSWRLVSFVKKKWTISINSYNFILQDTRSRWVRQSGGGMPPPRSRTGPPGPVTAAWSVWGTSVWIKFKGQGNRSILFPLNQMT